MKLKGSLRTVVAVVGLLAWNCVNAANVVFLNPGRTGEEFWDGYVKFMQAAASDLGMQLRVLDSQRDRDLMLAQARTVLQGAQKPDYLLFINEQYAAPEILRLAKDSGVKLFAVSNTLTTDQQRVIGSSRETYPNWIGSLVPNDVDAGYMLATGLIKHARESHPDQPLEMLAFSGVKQTPSSQEREQGLKKALAENPDVRLRVMTYGGWQRQRSYDQARTLFPRYPGINMVWTASDEMALGAMQAAEELGHKPGQDIHFATINSSAEALQAKIDGRIEVLVSGQFTIGGWALVMLQDYDKGLDFAKHGGKDRTLPIYVTLDEKQSARLAKRIAGKDNYGLDFRRYLLHKQSKLREYNFSLRPLID
ncbi:ABC transporter substrate-binding protein [Pseudomonas sp. GV071]|uniref:ABC transporter substrate-binding protein n=1 Tax=Pseudomonas sp. GV071 TaxID=2135754 RepID=UPI000D3BD14F|nr:ABC transporter substrate-binding protein [Pseudomonas sp. GV071]PTQ73842.1 monosaccharide ABC transporter substrate-binding protein (CUT2 family) [Pseudomonas sp. GV071]